MSHADELCCMSYQWEAKYNNDSEDSNFQPKCIKRGIYNKDRGHYTNQETTTNTEYECCSCFNTHFQFTFFTQGLKRRFFEYFDTPDPSIRPMFRLIEFVNW